MPIFPFSFLAAERLRRQVRRALRDLATTSGDGGQDGAPESEAVGPRLWVASLAGEALWLGSYQGAYDLSDAQWSAIATHLSGYGNLPLLRPLDVRPAQRTNDARLRDERPLVNAVLQLSQRRRLDTLTVADVAAASGCSATYLRTTFGDIDQVLVAVVREVHDDGFAGVSPLRLHLDRRTLAMSLQGLEDERVITAIHRLYAFADVPPTPRPGVRARAGALRGLNPRYFDHLELATAALAIDGWQGPRVVPAFYPQVLPHAVVLELRRLARLRAS
ncbi:hypothetical protein ACH47X_20060 [Promicromonospora kroppenstedtii]|uniref:Transcriptional regulator, TetR family n=1 Tax=Promicromonospora kroppenstedtii TaxID=440482 RepID=A0ABW7XQB9_9MICO